MLNRPMPEIRIDVLTLFPNMFTGPLQESLLGRALSNNLIEINVLNLRDFTTEKHKKVDDSPFGGGPGMVLQVEPIYNALKSLSALPEGSLSCENHGSDTPSPKLGRSPKRKTKPHVVYLSPQGKTLDQSLARELSGHRHLILLCGHYEGIDERAMSWVDEEISIGDYVLTGGELPSMVLLDAVARMIPGVVKEWESVRNDSFFDSRLDCSHYTRPQEFNGMKVPDVLISGNHRKIESWRQKDSLVRTMRKRPELIGDKEQTLQ